MCQHDVAPITLLGCSGKSVRPGSRANVTDERTNTSQDLQHHPHQHTVDVRPTFLLNVRMHIYLHIHTKTIVYVCVGILRDSLSDSIKPNIVVRNLGAKVL